MALGFCKEDQANMQLTESPPGKSAISIPIMQARKTLGLKDRLALQFITTSGPAAAEKSDLVSRRLVRAHARRSAYRNRGLSSTSCSPADSSSEVHGLPVQFHTSKFKLASWKVGNNKKKATLIIQSKPLLRNSNFYHPDLEPLPLTLTAEVGPINVLPIPLIPITEKILYFYQHEFQTNSLALNAEGNFYQVARTDPALLHAVLSTVAELRSLHLGTGDQITVVYHRSEAVRLINSRLKDDASQASSQLVTAVAALVNAEAIMSNLEGAAIHMRGLVTMVDLKGGLEAFDDCKVIQRVITWADFCFSSTWGIPLAFPLLLSLSHILPTSTQFISEIDLQYTQFGPSVILQPNMSILQPLTLLQSISRAVSAFPHLGGDRVLISNSIYVVEYQLLSLKLPKTDISVPTIDISESLALAGLLYLHLAIRELPLRARRYRRLIGCLGNSLPRDRDLSKVVAPDMGLRLLLWTLFIGAIAAVDSPFHSFFLESAVQVIVALKIRNYTDLEDSLKSVLWVDRFYSPHCATLWDEISLDSRLVDYLT